MRKSGTRAQGNIRRFPLSPPAPCSHACSHAAQVKRRLTGTHLTSITEGTPKPQAARHITANLPPPRRDEGPGMIMSKVSTRTANRRYPVH
jgi:hypothetical protein